MPDGALILARAMTQRGIVQTIGIGVTAVLLVFEHFGGCDFRSLPCPKIGITMTLCFAALLRPIATWNALGVFWQHAHALLMSLGHLPPNAAGLCLLSELCRMAVHQGTKKARAAHAIRQKAWKHKFALDAPGALKGTHFHTKWRPLWQPPPGSISKHPLAADPAAAATSEQDAWARVWRTPAGPSHEAEAPWELVPLVRLPPPASPYIAHQIRKVCAQFPTRTGLGADGWQFTNGR